MVGCCQKTFPLTGDKRQMIKRFLKSVFTMSVYRAACSFQPLRIIAANSLSIVSFRQAVITLNPIIPKLIIFLEALEKPQG